MDWVKKHVDTVIILGGILGSVLWMNGKFNELEKEVTVIKTVLFMKDILPKELAHNHGKEIGE
jgi:hypothetical protein